MTRQPPRLTRTDTLLPYTQRFRSTPSLGDCDGTGCTDTHRLSGDCRACACRQPGLDAWRRLGRDIAASLFGWSMGSATNAGQAAANSALCVPFAYRHLVYLLAFSLKPNSADLSTCL